VEKILRGRSSSAIGSILVLFASSSSTKRSIRLISTLVRARFRQTLDLETTVGMFQLALTKVAKDGDGEYCLLDLIRAR
jgi:hypothetical protein